MEKYIMIELNAVEIAVVSGGGCWCHCGYPDDGYCNIGRCESVYQCAQACALGGGRIVSCN